MATSFLSLSLSTQDDHGRQVSGFPPLPCQGWTGSTPTVRRFTLTAEDDTEIPVPDGTYLVASPLTDNFGLLLKATEGGDGIPLCYATALGLPWVQPWDGNEGSVWIGNPDDVDQTLDVYFY